MHMEVNNLPQAIDRRIATSVIGHQKIVQTNNGKVRSHYKIIFQYVKKSALL